jgi:hypothetical protein
LFDADSGFGQRIHKISEYFADIRGKNQNLKFEVTDSGSIDTLSGKRIAISTT